MNIEDFQSVSDRVPLLADLKPSGKYVMEDLHQVGGVPAVLKYLLQENLLDGSCRTVTGKTLAQNLELATDLPEDQSVIYSLSKPIKKTGHIRILRGNLAPGGAVAKITGKEGQNFSGPAMVFDGEEDMLRSLEENRIEKIGTTTKGSDNKSRCPKPLWRIISTMI